MASIVVAGDTSGTVTLAAPAVSGTTTLTLPVTTGTVLTNNSATVGSSGITFSDTSTQTAAASPYVLKNRIINGAMVIDQRKSGASYSDTDNTYCLDRFVMRSVTSGTTYTVQQNAGSVTPPTGFSYYLGVTSSSAYTFSGNQYFGIAQYIEGYNIADLAWGTANAKTVTLSFWVRSSLTGVFDVAIWNATFARGYVTQYTISSANTWTQISLTISGDTSGTWNTTNGQGINVFFNLGSSGTFNTSTLNTWGSSYTGSTTGTKVVSTNAATWYITGVQLEQNTSATPFERRLYNQELANCQRYCFVYRPSSNYAPYLMAHGINTTAMRGLLKFPQTMRTSPSLTFTAANTFQWSYGNVATSIALAEQGVDMSSVDIGSTGTSANGGYMITSANTTSSSIIGSAEL